MAIRFENLERFRSYLLLLARSSIPRKLQRRLDPEDLVQETLTQAFRDSESFRGRSDGEILAWLKSILAHRLSNAFRFHRQQKRDIGREQSVERTLDHSSNRLEALFPASQTSPSQHAIRKEEFLRACEALASLEPEEQLVVIYRFCKGWTFDRIAEEMGFTQAMETVRQGTGHAKAWRMCAEALKKVRGILENQ